LLHVQVNLEDRFPKAGLLRSGVYDQFWSVLPGFLIRSCTTFHCHQSYQRLWAGPALLVSSAVLPTPQISACLWVQNDKGQLGDLLMESTLVRNEALLVWKPSVFSRKTVHTYAFILWSCWSSLDLLALFTY
jgi:hypothetical protein